MTQITCSACHKAQPFMARMLYCTFCGTRHPDIETENASQRAKQDVIIARFKLAYGLGGFLLVFLIIPLLMQMLGFVEDKRFTNGAAALYWLSIIVWVIFIFTAPFAEKFAKRRHPEQASVE